MDTIDVIMPVYNSEKYLKESIESIINQSYKNFRLILIDDASTDHSKEICKNYAKKFNNIIFLENDKNSGLSYTRNRGLEKVDSAYVMFVDSDDWLDTNTFSELIKNCNNGKYDLIFFNYIKEFKDRSEKRNVYDTDKEIVEFNSKQIREDLHLKIFGLTNDELKRPEDGDRLVTACIKLYKSSIIKDNNINFIDTKIVGTEDALFNMEFIGKAKTALYLNKFYYHYRRDNINSLTRNFDNTLYFKWKNMYKIMNDYIDNNNLPDIYKEALKNRIIISIIGVGLNIVRSKISLKEKYNALSQILEDELYKKAKNNINLKYFSLKWKVFFLFVKYNMRLLLLLLLNIINYLIYIKKIRGKSSET